MNKVNVIKKITIFLALFLMVFSINSYATTCSEIENQAETFKNTGESQFRNMEKNASSQGKETVGDSISKNVYPIYRILFVGGILIVGICFVILGIQWVLSKSSPDAQAKLKARMVALAIAAGVIFGSYSIWSIVVKMLDAIDG